MLNVGWEKEEIIEMLIFLTAGVGVNLPKVRQFKTGINLLFCSK